MKLRPLASSALPPASAPITTVSFEITINVSSLCWGRGLFLVGRRRSTKSREEIPLGGPCALLHAEDNQLGVGTVLEEHVGEDEVLGGGCVGGTEILKRRGGRWELREDATFSM